MTTCPPPGLDFSIQLSLKSACPLIDWHKHSGHLMDCCSKFLKQNILQTVSVLKAVQKKYKSPWPSFFSLFGSSGALKAVVYGTIYRSILHCSGFPGSFTLQTTSWFLFSSDFNHHDFHFPRTSWMRRTNVNYLIEITGYGDLRY